VGRHVDSNNLVFLVVFLEFKRVVALVAINNEELVAANYPLSCMPIKVL
jgi:hypothetical protein